MKNAAVMHADTGMGKWAEGHAISGAIQPEAYAIQPEARSRRSPGGDGLMAWRGAWMDIKGNNHEEV